MENISTSDIERISDILNNAGGIVKQDRLKQLTPAEQRVGVKMWKEAVNFTSKQLEETISILKKYNEANKK